MTIFFYYPTLELLFIYPTFYSLKILFYTQPFSLRCYPPPPPPPPAINNDQQANVLIQFCVCVVFIRCFNFNGHDRFLVQQVDDATVAHVRCHLNATSIFKKPYRRKRRPETSQIPRLRPRVRHCVGDLTLEVKSCTWVPRITLLPRPQPSANCSRACVVP